MEWETVISIVSFIISTLLAIYIYRKEQWITKKQMMTDFFQEIFFDTLIYKLPNQLKRIQTNAHKKFDPEWLNEFEKVIRELRVTSYFYKYYDPDFYFELEDNLDMLNQYVGQLYNIEFVDNQMIEDTQKNLVGLYKELYSILFKYYYG